MTVDSQMLGVKERLDVDRSFVASVGENQPAGASPHGAAARDHDRELTPGTHLVERELSEALQISRGTLREAMRQLQQEELISAGARGRLSVRHLDAKEIKDIFDVRAALESLAASTLAARQDTARRR